MSAREKELEAGIRTLVEKCGQCHGKGTFEQACVLCDDSTLDHECVYRTVACMVCGPLRALLAAPASDTPAIPQPAPDVQAALADALEGLVNVLGWAAVNIEAGNLSAAEELGRRMSDASAALLLAGRKP